MKSEPSNFQASARNYLSQVQESFTPEILEKIENLTTDLLDAWIKHQKVFICGNGGSAANALHMANDFHYGIGACGEGKKIPGLHVDALPANTGVITCLANDTGYENIYAHQLLVKAKPNDILIVLSGSGNSPNVVKAIETAIKLGVKSYAIVAFDGGKCKSLADQCIHFQVNDMQIAEDSQLLIGHICMQWLTKNKPRHLERDNND